MKWEAFNKAMANIESGLGTSILLTQNTRQQAVMDMIGGLLQGMSGYFAKKFRAVEVKLKAGYKVTFYARQQ